MLVAEAENSEIYSDLAYAYDGTLEGLLSAIFAAYARREDPSDVEPICRIQPRLSQYVYEVPTSIEHAQRVRKGLTAQCGQAAFSAVKCASLSDASNTGTAAYRFVRYAMDTRKQPSCPKYRKLDTCSNSNGRGPCPKMRVNALSDITHPLVAPIHRICNRVGDEREKMLQFIRFEELEGGIWFAKCNPNASVIPLVMDHFASRFNTQPFVIYDENHHLAGVYEGRDWHLVRTDGASLNLPRRTESERAMQDAWRRFYRTVAVESRYNPELRQHFMPKCLWKNLTEMQETPESYTPVQSNAGMKLSSQAPPSCQK